MNEIEQQMLERLEKRIVETGVSNEFLVQICELSGKYLNLRTISDYAKENKMSYNGAKRFRNVISLFNCKFIIDNY